MDTFSDSKTFKKMIYYVSLILENWTAKEIMLTQEQKKGLTFIISFTKM